MIYFSNKNVSKFGDGIAQNLSQGITNNFFVYVTTRWINPAQAVMRLNLIHE